MLLIVNADDFGYTAGVNRGILRAAREGVVRSTSLLMNQPGTDEALALLRSGALTGAGAGVHLCLTAGRPLSNPAAISTLVDVNGFFKKRAVLWADPPPGDDVRREFRAQIERALEAGVAVDHLDTHHHVHRHPVVLDALIEVAREYDLPVRALDAEMRARLAGRGVATPDCFCGEWYDDGVSAASFRALVSDGLRRGARVMELMCHPGQTDEALRERSGYTEGRERELAVLSDPALRRWLAERGIITGTYGALRDAQGYGL